VRRALAAVAVVLASASACSGGGGGPGELTLEAGDIRFVPETVVVQAGGQVTVALRNTDSVRHNLSVPGVEADVDVEPGRSVNVIFVPPGTGALEFFCKYHREQGMRGTFQVR
jgi:plastocyanin